jgi:putative zinc finger/helix-turn-helix YgiT family protein
MKCLTCQQEKFEKKRLRFNPEIKDQQVDVVVPCYVCTSCSTPFMNTAQMNLLRRATADRYRQLNGLLTSEQIIRYRESLGMSQTGFARYLNVGEASIKRWETYFIQDASQDEHIRLKCDEAYAETNYLNVHWKRQEPDIFSGNKKLSFELLKNVALYLVSKTKETIIYLNKLHFYIDFYHFKKYGRSITGVRYVPLKYGPCPDQYKVIYDNLVNSGVLTLSGEYKYQAVVKPDLSLFDDKEKETLDYVYKLYKDYGGKALFELSHQEKAYVDTPECTFISYEYAKDLKI